MKLLAFEAATRRISVALWLDGKLSEKAAEMPNGGSELLLPLGERTAGRGRLDAQAAGRHRLRRRAGRVYRLRLACGVAQGLACGLDLPVVPVGSLAALALASNDGKVLACLDARMNEVYVAAYLVSGDSVEELMPPKVGAGATAPLPEGAGWRGVGDGFGAWGAILRERLGPRLIGADAELLFDRHCSGTSGRAAACAWRGGGCGGGRAALYP